MLRNRYKHESELRSAQPTGASPREVRHDSAQPTGWGLQRTSSGRTEAVTIGGDKGNTNGIHTYGTQLRTTLTWVGEAGAAEWARCVQGPTGLRDGGGLAARWLDSRQDQDDCNRHGDRTVVARQDRYIDEGVARCTTSRLGFLKVTDEDIRRISTTGSTAMISVNAKDDVDRAWPDLFGTTEMVGATSKHFRSRACSTWSTTTSELRANRSA